MSLFKQNNNLPDLVLKIMQSAAKKISNSFEIVPIRFLNETSFTGRPNALYSEAKRVIQTDVREGFCSHTWPDSVSHDQSSSNMYLLL